MTEDEYLASDITDEWLGAQADAGDQCNDEQGYYDQPTQSVLEQLIRRMEAELSDEFNNPYDQENPYFK